MSLQTRELSCRTGTLGIITLDSPATLNALSHSMVNALQQQLDQWAADDNVCLVLLNANGERAFCAGIDLRELYQYLTDDAGSDPVSDLFAPEYRLDYSLHTFPKPVIALAHGITFGGGMGLLQASRYRLVTPDTLMAMPEAAIGLFPDAGASWFLNRLPGSLGLFMGLTGARLNASDAMRVGLADRVIERSQETDLIARITEQHWSGEIAADDNRLFRLLNQTPEAAPDELPDSELARYEQDIARLCRRDDMTRVVQRLQDSSSGNAWWNACMESLRQACPVSLGLLERQLSHALQMSLKDIFQMELAMTAHCVALPDLREGIRARMIDRDGQPAWSYRSLEQVPPDVVEAHFDAPWTADRNPLALA